MFQNPDMLLLLLLIPVLALFLAWRALVRSSILHKIGDEALIQLLTSRISQRNRILKILLWFGCIVLLIVALAQPTWGSTIEIQRGMGIRIIFLVDTSRSMDVRDISPTRLDRARIDLQTIVSQLDGNEFAIVSFTDTAFLYMPFTYDIRAVDVFIDSLSTDMISSGGTAIARGLEQALAVLHSESDAAAFIVLISDGEDHEPDAITMAQIAGQRGIPVYALGYGTSAGGPVPLYDANGNLVGYKTFNDGLPVNSSRNDTLLRQIAASSNGVYFPMDAANSLDMLIAGLKNSQSGELGERIIQRPRDVAVIFIIAALALLSLEIIISDSKRDAA